MFEPVESSTYVPVVPLRDWMRRVGFSRRSPFLTRGVFSLLPQLVVLGTFLVRVFEKIFCEDFYVKNRIGALIELDHSALRLLQTLIKSGLVARWRLHKAQTNGQRIFICSLDFPSTITVSGTAKFRPRSSAAGAGVSANAALIPALGEFLERHAQFVWSEDNLRTNRWSEQPNFIRPSRFLWYTPMQLTDDYLIRSRNVDEAMLTWVGARNFANKKKYIPAEVVYLSYGLVKRDEPLFGATTSNGSAAGATYTTAAVRALLEAIERDAFLIFWFNKLTPSQIDVKSFTRPEHRAAVADFELWGFAIHLFDITTDLAVPTFCGILLNKHDRSLIAVATVTDFDVEHLITKLLIDLGRWAASYGTYTLQPYTGPAEKIKTFRERESYWHFPNSLDQFHWLFEGGWLMMTDLVERYHSLKNLQQARNQYAFLRQVFLDHKYDCYFVDVTTPIAKKSGLWVVKAVAPDLVPMFFDERKKPLGVNRLYEAPVLMGHRQNPTHSDMLNPLPHPFI